MTFGHVLKEGVFVVAAKRTPFGTYGGSLASISPINLAVHAAKAAIESAGEAFKNNKDIIGSVPFANVLTTSDPGAIGLSRFMALRVGLPVNVPAYNVNRLCGSGFQSLINGAQDILMGDVDVALVGGAENMSACCFAVRDIRFGTRLGSKLELEDTLWTSLTDVNIMMPMGITAENLASKYKLERQEVDEFALRSQQKWALAQEKGYFKDEVAPMELEGKKGSKVIMDKDEHPKTSTTLENLAKLKPVFKKDGVVTAGGSSGICDGAAALILANEKAIKAHNLQPLARIVAYAVSGCDPAIMGIGPVDSMNTILEKTKLTFDDIDQLEINEAFAAQTVACVKELKLPMEKLNTCGGAIALGHPLGASGARISAHLVHKLRKNGEKRALGSACIGGGQGIGVLFESVL